MRAPFSSLKDLPTDVPFIVVLDVGCCVILCVHTLQSGPEVPAFVFFFAYLGDRFCFPAKAGPESLDFSPGCKAAHWPFGLQYHRICFSTNATCIFVIPLIHGTIGFLQRFTWVS